MFDTLEKLQEKPEPARKRLAFFVSLLVVLVIVIVWASTFSARNKSNQDIVSSDSVTPLSSILDSFERAVIDVKDTLTGVDEYVAPEEGEAPDRVLDFGAEE